MGSKAIPMRTMSPATGRASPRSSPTIGAFARVPFASLLAALTTGVAPAAEVLPHGFPTRPGPLAFYSAQLYTDPQANAAQLDWLSNFELHVTNGFGLANEDTRRPMQRKGCKLFLYAWTNGFYESWVGVEHQEGPWRTELAENHRDWLLSSDALPSQMGPPAFYFDLDNEDMVTYRCKQLADYRARTGYDGVFFDYAGEWGLPKEVAELWQRRHPAISYGEALIGLFRRLREVDPGVLIFTNQAHRSAEPVLAEVDYDMTESFGTSQSWGPEATVGEEILHATYFRPWTGAAGIEALYTDSERHLAQTPPRKGFVYLDYMRPWYQRDDQGGFAAKPDREAVYYSYCAAALWGRPAFCSGWFADWEYDGPLYFADLGRPLGDAPEVLDGVAVREYQRGVVALLTRPKPATVIVELQVTASHSLYDLFAGTWRPIAEGKAELALQPSQCGLSGARRAAARVYLKAKRLSESGGDGH